MTTITTHPQRQMKKGPVMAALGAALVIAAVAAGGFWLAVGRDDSGSAGATVASQPAPAPVAGSKIGASGTRGHLTFYLVASQEEADQMLSGIDQSNQIRAAEGVAPMEAQVFVISSAAELARVRQAIKDEADFRAGAGLPGITVTDLRVAPVAPPAVVEPEGPTSGDLTPANPFGNLDPSFLP